MHDASRVAFLAFLTRTGHLASVIGLPLGRMQALRIVLAMGVLLASCPRRLRELRGRKPSWKQVAEYYASSHSCLREKDSGRGAHVQLPALQDGEDRFAAPSASSWHVILQDVHLPWPNAGRP